MGCSCSREKTALEEELLEVQELVKYPYNCEFVYGVHEKYANSHNLISAEEWNEIRESLEISCHPSVFNFYCGFKNDEGFYNLKKLEILSILLSQGNTESKVDILFRVFGGIEVEELHKRKIKKLLIIMTEIAVEHLPKLIIDQREKLNKYLASLSNSTNKFIENSMKSFDQDNLISQRRFVAYLQSDKDYNLIEPSNLRLKISMIADKDLFLVTETSDQNATNPDVTN
ncbi:hypothetical protein SteCoe_2444 [Stentor coeruleus]|uniref:Uncharacterized protein n=1 Tax=Stentor coeruleus TaxID=5963 RepID=A0A1R2CZG5_9CILI|nr:hypothetical protein SteCoe_2444 [Stentor coeruleus]